MSAPTSRTFSDVEQAQLIQEPAAPQRSAQFFQMVTILFLGGLYILCSAALITFNKWMIQEGRFPYAIALVMIHMGFSSVCSFLLFIIRPSMFPAISGDRTPSGEKTAFDWKVVWQGALPIAVLFSFSLVLNNTAYMYSSVAFLQMMKEGNVVLVFLFSLLASMEKATQTKIGLLCGVMIATCCTVRGELNFSFTGFVVQGSAMVCECARIVMQAYVMLSAGKKLDALSYNLIVSPLCFTFLGLMVSCLLFVHPLEAFRTPAWSELVDWGPVLLVNASLAFTLNIVVAFFIKQSSAVAYILAGICKDSMIVSSGVLFMGETISRSQVGAFSVQLYLIWIWSMTKTFPETFAPGFSQGLMAMHGFGKTASKLEQQSLTLDAGDKAAPIDSAAKGYDTLPVTTTITTTAKKPSQ